MVDERGVLWTLHTILMGLEFLKSVPRTIKDLKDIAQFLRIMPMDK